MDRLAQMALKTIGNRAQSNPEEFKKYAGMMAQFAARPNVQEKALSFGKKGLKYLSENPQLKSRALQALNLNGMGSQAPLEQRVAALEQKMDMIMGMAQQYSGGGKTRKQKRKQRKTPRTKATTCWEVSELANKPTAAKVAPIIRSPSQLPKKPAQSRLPGGLPNREME